MSKYRRKEELEDETSYSEEFEAQAAVDSEPKEPEEASFKKRYGDLRRHSQNLMAQKDKDLETVKARKRANEALEEGEKRLGHLKDLETKLTKKEAEQQLMKLHPDFGEIRQDPAFHEWVTMQPIYISDALYKNNTDATAASRAIDLYKSDTGKRKSSSNKSAAQAVGRSTSASPSTNSKAKFSESQVARMSDREYEANEEAILTAMRTDGAFTYDMSGGAR